MRSNLTDSNVDFRGTAQRLYWRRNLALIAVLMTIWLIVTFGIGYFAREVSFSFLGLPFSFWVGGQGALVVYVALVGYYAWAMNRLDRSFDDVRSDAPGDAEVGDVPTLR